MQPVPSLIVYSRSNPTPHLRDRQPSASVWSLRRSDPAGRAVRSAPARARAHDSAGGGARHLGSRTASARSLMETSKRSVGVAPVSRGDRRRGPCHAAPPCSGRRSNASQGRGLLFRSRSPPSLRAAPCRSAPGSGSPEDLRPVLPADRGVGAGKAPTGRNRHASDASRLEVEVDPLLLTFRAGPQHVDETRGKLKLTPRTVDAEDDRS